LETVFFVHHRIASAVKRVEFVSSRVSYVVLRGRWCNIVVLNEHAPSEEKNDDWKDSFDVDRFNPRKASELEVRKHYRIIISNRFAALEYLNDSEGIKLGKTVQRISKPLLKWVYVCMNWGSISRGLTKKAHDC